MQLCIEGMCYTCAQISRKNKLKNLLFYILFIIKNNFR